MENSTADSIKLDNVQNTISKICRLCNKEFKRHRYLNAHIKRHLQKASITLNSEKCKFDEKKQFTCGICLKKFKGKTSLAKHIERHNNGKTCKVCEENFMDVDLFKLHNQIHKDEKQDEEVVCSVVEHLVDEAVKLCENNSIKPVSELHICRICGGQFSQLLYLKRHMKECDLDYSKRKYAKKGKIIQRPPTKPCEEYPVKLNQSSNVCRICNKGFPHLRYLNRHTKKIHSVELSFTCIYCDKTFNTYSSLKIHKLIHGDKTFTCEICPLKFTQKIHLTEHVKTHKRCTEKMCRICSESFSSGSLLKIHEKIHKLKLICEVCKKPFTRKDKFNQHVKSHSTENSYDCKECGKSFRISSGLTAHKKIHVIVKAYRCDVCDFSCNNASNLNAHMKRHDGQKLYECKICSKTFGMLSQLKQHHYKHDSEKQFSCKICKKSFKLHRSLQNHLLNNKARPTNCKKCRKHFSNSCELLKHKEVHKSEKIVCINCKKQFTKRSNLLVHEKTVHKKERSFMCDICLKGFATKGSLKLHVKLIHSKDINRKTSTE